MADTRSPHPDSERSVKRIEILRGWYPGGLTCHPNLTHARTHTPSHSYTQKKTLNHSQKDDKTMRKQNQIKTRATQNTDEVISRAKDCSDVFYPKK